MQGQWSLAVEGIRQLGRRITLQRYLMKYLA